MSYEVWIDADGNYHYIPDMSSSYIKNCIKELKRVIKSYRLDTDHPMKKTANPADNGVLRQNWSIDHAVNFLNAFESELESR